MECRSTTLGIFRPGTSDECLFQLYFNGTSSGARSDRSSPLLQRQVGRLSTVTPVRFPVAWPDGPGMRSLLFPCWTTNSSTLPQPHRRDVTQLWIRVSESQVFVLPSTRGSSGTVYCEAMSQGVSIVDTPGKEIADFIVDGQDGFLVPPNDPGSLVRAPRTLYGVPEFLRRIAQAGRIRFERTGVRWADSGSAHLELFEQLIRTSH